jgi:hypothetical protein
MGNVPVQVINPLIENKNSEPATGTRIPDWLKETSLEKEEVTEVGKRLPAAEQLSSISNEPIGPEPQEEKVDTLISNPEPPVRVVDETFQEINPVATIAPDTTDNLTITAKEIEQKEFITGITAHGRVK